MAGQNVSFRERKSNKCLICDSALIASSSAVWSNTCDFYAHMAAAAAAAAVYFCFVSVLTVSHQVWDNCQVKNDTSDCWSKGNVIKTNTLLHSWREQTAVSNRMNTNMTHWHSSVNRHIYQLHFVYLWLCFLFFILSQLKKKSFNFLSPSKIKKTPNKMAN